MNKTEQMASDVLRADVEIPAVVQDKMSAALEQVRAESPDAEQAAATPSGGHGAPAQKGRRGARLRKLKLWQIGAGSAAAVFALALVVGAGGLLLSQVGPQGGFDRAVQGSAPETGATEAADTSAAETDDLGETLEPERNGSGATAPQNALKSAGGSGSAAAGADAAAQQGAVEGKSADAGDDGFSAGAGAAAGNAKITYSAKVSVETTDFPKAREALREKVSAVGGIVSSEHEATPQSSAGGVSTKAVVTVRVPADSYEQFVESLSDVGAVVSKSSEAQNVTKQYSQAQAELESLKVQRKRLRELMSQAEGLDDLLEVEDRLTEVEAEISAAENYKADLDTDISYSTVTVTLTDVTSRPQTSAELSLPERLAQAASDGWAGFVRLIEYMLLTLIAIWPLLVVVAAGTAGAAAIVRKRGKAGAREEAAGEEGPHAPGGA